MVVIVMGVTGCGKTTVGKTLGEILGWPFYDADKFHPEENVEKMRQGIALTDDDRIPWLNRLAEIIDDACTKNENIILACSALKEKYRTQLRGNNSEKIRLVYLKGTIETIRSRLEVRKHHYMNPNLLPSQFQTLEEPSPATSLHIDITPEPEVIVSNLRAELGL